jgi:hypothetical protein
VPPQADAPAPYSTCSVTETFAAAGDAAGEEEGARTTIVDDDASRADSDDESQGSLSAKE